MTSNVIETVLSTEDQALAQAEIRANQAAFATDISLYMTRMAVVTLILFIVLAVITRQTRFLVFATLATLLLIGWGSYPILHRRGQTTLGLHAGVLSLLLIVGIVPLVMPAMLPAIGIGCAQVIVLAHLLLGRRNSLWVAGLSGLTFVADLVITETIGAAWITPMDATTSVVVTAIIATMAIGLSILMARVIVIGQQEQYSLVQLANREIAQRAALEQAQREQLEAATHEIEDRVAAEQAQRAFLQDLLSQIQQVTSALQVAALDILATANQQATSATAQDTSVTRTVATVDDVRTTVMETANRAQGVADASEQSLQVSQEGQNAVGNSIESMEAIQQNVAEIAGTILTLSERTQQIGEIIATVNALADQSKLLALNASIEAARAGEEGKGFAIVALEVRQLADQSRQATARVQAILEEIQQATHQAVMVTEAGIQATDQGVRRVEHAGHAIRDLAGILEVAIRAVSQIVATTQQQAAGVDQLADEMHHIQVASTQTAASAQQTEARVQRILQLAQQLERAASGDGTVQPASDPTGDLRAGA